MFALPFLWFFTDFRGPRFDFRPEGPQQASLGQSEVRW